MNEHNFPWAMDKPVDELRMMLAEEASYDVLDETLAINYLLARIKKAESEWDVFWALVKQ